MSGREESMHIRERMHPKFREGTLRDEKKGKYEPHVRMRLQRGAYVE
jgi:hypothetical protein